MTGRSLPNHLICRSLGNYFTLRGRYWRKSSKKRLLLFRPIVYGFYLQTIQKFGELPNFWPRETHTTSPLHPPHPSHSTQYKQRFPTYSNSNTPKPFSPLRRHLTMLQFLLLLSVISITIAQLPPSDDIPRLWPKPASIISISNALNLNADPSSFTIVATSTDDVLDDAIQNIRGRIFSRSSGFYDSSLSGIDLETLEVSVKQTLTPTTYPSLGDDESYTLHIGETSTLESNTTWGALRGLETFSQLFTMNRGFTITSGNGMLITDSPRFPWRGLMLDPARHFMSVEKIKKQIGAMSQSKLNVLHLHLSDGESFTVNTEHWERYGNISKFGSYSPALTYSQSDLNDIVSFGRLKGVRVVPEFDLPAHMASWAIGVAERGAGRRASKAP